MNYRHAFHAGNVGDVLKHVVVERVLAHLQVKPKPLFVLDTHAGPGLYDLAGAEATRTGEAAGGIDRLLAHPAPHAALAGYLDLVAQARMTRGPAAYPGSPLLAASLLRPGDRLVAVERHPQEAAALRTLLGRRPGVSVRVGEDGYAALAGLLPPPQRRGLVLMDPPFEDRAEFGAMVAALVRAHRRFPTGVYVVWYPLKDPGAVEAFHQHVLTTGLPRALVAELWVRPLAVVQGLAGCGLLLVNPPWRLDDTLGDLLPWLVEALEVAPGRGGWRLAWLRGEGAAGT